MIRIFVAGVAASFVLALSLPAATAYAQTCTPACVSGQHCIYTGLTEDPAHTQCSADGVVDEVVVTGTRSSSGSLKDIVNGTIIPLGNSIVALLMAVAFLLFIFGVFRYFFLKPGDSKAREAGRGFIVWSIIALAVLFSVWGLVNLVIHVLPA